MYRAPWPRGVRPGHAWRGRDLRSKTIACRRAPCRRVPARQGRRNAHPAERPRKSGRARSGRGHPRRRRGIEPPPAWALRRKLAPRTGRTISSFDFPCLYSRTYMSITTRFAPSPTGYLHLGHAYSAWNAWRRADFRLLRLEDIDTTRCRPEFSTSILEDLRWLGLNWEGTVRVQSEHMPEYQAALDRLRARGVLDPCFCSRAEIAQAQSAPHGGANIYPGTCRKLSEAERRDRIASGRPYALRLDMAAAIAQAGAAQKYFEEGTGWVTAMPGQFGDIVLARRDIPT